MKNMPETHDPHAIYNFNKYPKAKPNHKQSTPLDKPASDTPGPKTERPSNLTNS